MDTFSRTDLSKDVAGQGLVQSRLHVNEFKEVQAVSVFLHDHLEVTAVLKDLQHLVAESSNNTQR